MSIRIVAIVSKRSYGFCFTDFDEFFLVRSFFHRSVFQLVSCQLVRVTGTNTWSEHPVGFLCNCQYSWNEDDDNNSKNGITHARKTLSLSRSLALTHTLALLHVILSVRGSEQITMRCDTSYLVFCSVSLIRFPYPAFHLFYWLWARDVSMTMM